jgi:hypothetical protein
MYLLFSKMGTYFQGPSVHTGIVSAVSHNIFLNYNNEIKKTTVSLGYHLLLFALPTLNFYSYSP